MLRPPAKCLPVKSCASLIGLTLLLTSRSWGAPDPELVSSRNLAVLPRVAGSVSSASWSGDGRFVVFVSDAPNLVTNDFNRGQDVFRHDLTSGQTELVSLLPGLASNRDSTGHSPSASHDGRFVAFTGGGPGDGREDVFVRDLALLLMFRVSEPAAGVGEPNGASGQPFISADGGRVVFVSQASNLISNTDTNGNHDVFLRDLKAGTLLKLSPAPVGRSPYGGFPGFVASRDARVVAFRTDDATQPAVAVPNATDLWVWREQDPKPSQLVLPGPTSPLVVPTFNVTLSADGRRLAFRNAVLRDRPGFGGVWWFDLAAGTNALASVGILGQAEVATDDDAGPVLSADGFRMAFVARTDTNSPPRIFVWDAATGLHTLNDLVQTDPPTLEEPAHPHNLAFSPDGGELLFMTAEAVPAAGVSTAGALRLFRWRFGTGQVTETMPGRDFGGTGPGEPEYHADGGRILAVSRPVVPANRQGRAPTEAGWADMQGQYQPILPSESFIPSATGTDASGAGQISADGRWVAFTSDAPDLDPGDTNGWADVFVKDRQTGMLVRASVGADGAQAEGPSRLLRLTPDGRQLLFWSAAPGLVHGDTNAVADLFLRDLAAGTTRLVSARGQTEQSGDDWVGAAAMTPDGRWVAFESWSTNLVSGSVNRKSQIFLRDTLLQHTSLVPSNPASYIKLSGLSDDGARIAFRDMGDAWVFERNGSLLRRLTADRKAGEFLLSGDGGTAAVVTINSSGAELPVRPGIRLFDLRPNPPAALATNAWPRATMPKFAGNHLWFLATRPTNSAPPFLPGSGDDGRLDLYRQSLLTGLVQLVSVRPDNLPGDAGIRSYAVDATGEVAVFATDSSDLLGAVGSSVGQVLTRDLRTGVTALVSQNPITGAPAAGTSFAPALSASGSVAVFVTFAPDLGAADLNGSSDLFASAVTAVLSEDTDDDGLPNAWERSHFGNLAQRAGDDPDQDGQSNLDELRAHTAPADAASTLRITTAEWTAEATLRLRWPSQPGVRYRIEQSGTADGWDQAILGPELAGTGGDLNHETQPAAGTTTLFVRVVVP